jgi:hypothetical protein
MLTLRKKRTPDFDQLEMPKNLSSASSFAQSSPDSIAIFNGDLVRPERLTTPSS